MSIQNKFKNAFSLNVVATTSETTSETQLVRSNLAIIAYKSQTYRSHVSYSPIHASLIFAIEILIIKISRWQVGCKNPENYIPQKFILYG